VARIVVLANSTRSWASPCRNATSAPSGETHITARVRDEAEMFGLIERLRNLGAALISASVDP
jgi:hypothetical protein